MIYSSQLLSLLETGANGQLNDYWEYSFDLLDKLGEDEEFANGLIAENEPLYDLINDFDLILFFETHDTNDVEGYKKFIAPYYEKAKLLVK